MKYTLLVTCGTSLLSNANRDAGSEPAGIKEQEQMYNRLALMNKKYNFAKLARLEPGSIDDSKIKDNHTNRGSELFQTLLDYINKKKGASAEVNTITLLMEEYKILPSDVENIFLYHSDTGTGTLCAKIIEEHLKSKGLNVQLVQVNGFSSAKTLEQFQEGMMDLMSKIVRIVKRRKHHSSKDSKVYVLATAGFKPESTAAVIAALLAGADGIYYVYESTRELVMIPPIPLAIDEGVKRYIDSIFGADYKNDVPIALLLERGILDYDMLEEKGLIERKGELNDKIRLRDWVKELLD